LNSSDSSSEPPDSTVPDDAQQQSPTGSNQSKGKWSITKAAFDELLGRFSSDREEAAIRYETTRRKLIRFFEWNLVAGAEDWTDETLNRVARRIEEGQNIDNLTAYIWGVARIVLKEAKKDGQRAPISLDETTGVPTQKAPEIIDPDERQICFDRCLAELPAESRDLILQYYEGMGAVKIKHRQEIADKMEIPLNALRIRVHRIRRVLEKCIAECLQAANSGNE
jgi:RNA polymerase sigma factor (sigma-70 family)